MSFRQRWPWIGPDLQTLRDTFALHPWSVDSSQRLPIRLPDGGALLLKLDLPQLQDPCAWVLLVHGLAGSSERPGVQRLAGLLVENGFAVGRLNLRGAGEGRAMASGTYAAACNRDLFPVLATVRQQALDRPLLGVGLSLGGTVLLNALLALPDGLDGLACVSSPINLAASSREIERTRNFLYHRYMLREMVRQTLADPQAIPPGTLAALDRVGRIRDFDALITAPRWGYADIDRYYSEASPLEMLCSGIYLPPLLLIQALDDPLVPTASLIAMASLQLPDVEICLPGTGGHNGFHGVGDSPSGSWADRRVLEWLLRWHR